MSESPPPAEDPVLQGGDAADFAEQDAPNSKPPADDAAAPNAGEDGNDDAGDNGDGADVAAATAAAAAVAARLMAEHGQQAYPVGSGAEHAQEYTAEANINKRGREDDEAGDDPDAPDKKRPTNGMTSAGFEGTDPLAGGLAGLGGDGGPAGDPPGADMVTETFDVPGTMVGKLIGKGGETIRNLQVSTDTRIQVDHTGEGPNKRITISGYTQEHVQNAKDAVMALDVEEAQRIVECPPNLVGRIIGRGGETIRALQSASEAHITVNQDFPPDQNRQVVIQGGDQAIERAVLMVNELIHGEPGSAQAVIQRICQAHGIGKSEVMTAPKMIIGRIIGRGGETIKQIQKTSGATVQIDQSGDPCKLSLAGQASAVEQAKAYITEIMNGGDPFGGGMGGPGMYGGGGPGGGGGGGYGGPMQGGAPGGYGGYGGYPPAAAGYGGYPGAPGGYGGGGGGYPGAAMYGGYGGYPADPYAAAQYGGGAGGGYPGGDVAAAGGGGGQAAAAAAPAAGGGGGAWQEYKDDQGRAYYYNATTGVTQWEKPADF